MSQESAQTNREERSAAEVDRIRDILFGPQMRGYEQQIKRMAGQLDLLGKKLEDLVARLDQQQGDQESRMRRFQEEMQKRHSELERMLTSQLGQTEANLEQQATETRQLAADLRKEGQDLRSEFTNALADLEDGKTSRHDLGDLLMEMGTRLKGQMGLVDLLGQLEEAAQDQSAD
jgi:DNA repair exonuclease SbcCD ATPase subunit